MFKPTKQSKEYYKLTKKKAKDQEKDDKKKNKDKEKSKKKSDLYDLPGDIE